MLKYVQIKFVLLNYLLYFLNFAVKLFYHLKKYECNEATSITVSFFIKQLSFFKDQNKFKPLLDIANTLFRRHYQPEQDVCVDGNLVGTRGGRAMLRYISSKHSKFGIKFWVLAESATGYIIRMTCNLGKKFQPVTSGFCEGTTVFMDLLRESLLLGRGYHVFPTVFSLPLNWPKLYETIGLSSHARLGQIGDYQQRSRMRM